MTGGPETVEALQVTVTAPVTSFRDPLYDGVQAGLPCPPPATIAGMLAAAAGGWDRVPYDTRFGAVFTAEGRGTDLETFHPLDAQGRVTEAVPKQRAFLVGVMLMLWLTEDIDLWEAAIRRPVWPLRLGRSQDLAAATASAVRLVRGPGRQGHAITPEPLSRAGVLLRLPAAVSSDRARTRWEAYRYAASGSSDEIPAALATAGGQAVPYIEGVHPQTAGSPRRISGNRVLLAKSASALYLGGEPLTAHLRATLDAAIELRTRVGKIAAVPDHFWSWVLLAALLHDAGKTADGFQTMLTGGPTWGERHEVCSLGFAAMLLAGMADEDLLWVATGIITHHRPLTSQAGRRALFPLYSGDSADEFAARLGSLNDRNARDLLQWLDQTARRAGLLRTPSAEFAIAELAAAAHQVLNGPLARWEEECTESEGLTAVLLQGAVTLADHLSSAHRDMLAGQPVDGRLAGQIAERIRLRPHQSRAAAVTGHMLLRSPTGSGKTEAALLWAAAQVEDLRRICGGQPRVFYTLPYLASINAMVGRLGELIDDDMIGIAHSRAASYHLSRSLRGGAGRQQAAETAVSRQAATRLFREPVRVGTPYQLLRGALVGPVHSSILADAANSVFILDELHAYDARRFGMILAMAGFWARIGGRVAVLSATLPEPVVTLLQDTLGTVDIVEARREAWPARHRLRARPGHLTDGETIGEITGRLHAGEAVLVVANNVADARYLYRTLAPAARDLHGDDAAILLHSRFRTKDRTRIEKDIIRRYEAGKPRAPGLLVATQVVEISLNIDFDVIYTSGAPLEPLLQRFGRVNRLGRRPPADVIVHTPRYRPVRGNPGLRADGVYEADPARLAMDILARHDGAVISESDAARWLDEIYRSPWGAHWQRGVTGHRDAFTRDFLTFTYPYDDRSALSKSFDEMFDGTDAILASDIGDYKKALNTTEGQAGRLLGAEYLIPMPSYARREFHYDPDLNISVIDAEYSSEEGLGPITAPRGNAYQPENLP